MQEQVHQEIVQVQELLHQEIVQELLHQEVLQELLHQEIMRKE